MEDVKNIDQLVAKQQEEVCNIFFFWPLSISDRLMCKYILMYQVTEIDQKHPDEVKFD